MSSSKEMPLSAWVVSCSAMNQRVTGSLAESNSAPTMTIFANPVRASPNNSLSPETYTPIVAVNRKHIEHSFGMSWRLKLASQNHTTLNAIAMVALIGLYGCSSQSTMMIWDKPNISPDQRTNDNLECGAVQEGSKIVVHEVMKKRHDSCMASKGYSLKQVQATSTWRAGPQGPRGSIDDPAYRRAVSFNTEGVSVDASCVGLFAPKLELKLFRNAIPAWHLTILNNSQNRYSVSYDLKVRHRGSNYFGSYNETTAEERIVTSRPGAMEEYIVLQGKQDLTVVAVDIFRCSPDGRRNGDSPSLNSGGPKSPAAEITPTPGAVGITVPASPAPKLSPTELTRAIQQQLRSRGLYSGAVDGQFGPRTREAILKYQRQSKLPATGEASEELLTNLRKPE